MVCLNEGSDLRFAVVVKVWAVTGGGIKGIYGGFMCIGDIRP